MKRKGDVSRRDIYYWKCDRPAAFHGTGGGASDVREIETMLANALLETFGAAHVALRPGGGQGNHLTFIADVDDRVMFVRVENGPERDGHLAIESRIADLVRRSGVPVPRVHGCDASRSRVPFAWQALELIQQPDLNHWLKQGMLAEAGIAFEIGVAVGRWQSLTFEGFGILEDAGGERLAGGHACYRDYYYLQLDRHLGFLVSRGFLTAGERAAMERVIMAHGDLLGLAGGCFVHKDLALWNVLGTPQRIAAFIDFDDAISGDEMDDLSLLACFHDGGFVGRALAGYASVRPLPEAHMQRLWLHLLRNMIVKAVIRVGGGYFDRDDGFFLIGAGGSGASLEATTRSRLMVALDALEAGGDLDRLG